MSQDDAHQEHVETPEPFRAQVKLENRIRDDWPWQIWVINPSHVAEKTCLKSDSLRATRLLSLLSEAQLQALLSRESDPLKLLEFKGNAGPASHLFIRQICEMEPVERWTCCEAFDSGALQARSLNTHAPGEFFSSESPVGQIQMGLMGLTHDPPWAIPFSVWDTRGCFEICRAFAFGPFKFRTVELLCHVIPSLYRGNWSTRDAVAAWRCHRWFLDVRNAYAKIGSDLAKFWLRMAPNAGDPDPIYRFLRSPSAELAHEAELFIDNYEPVRAPSDEQCEDTGGDKERWLTVTEAATHSGISAGVISRAADSGELKSNGKKERERRIDTVDLARWGLERAKKSKPTESDERVKQLSKQNVRDYRE